MNYKDKIELKDNQSLTIKFPNGSEIIIYSNNYDKYIGVNSAYSQINIIPKSYNQIELNLELDERQKYLNKQKEANNEV